MDNMSKSYGKINIMIEFEVNGNSLDWFCIVFYGIYDVYMFIINNWNIKNNKS